jgi:hypothetical protein
MNGECRFTSPVAFAARPAHSCPVMSAFRTLRRLPQHHPVVVRGVLLLLLAIVTFASMPKWIVHGHDGAHETTPSLAIDVPGDHHHDDAGEPIVPLPDGSHVHAHYLGGATATLPATLAGLCQLAVPGDACPPWQDASTSDGPLTRLHRPPIV